MMYNNFCLLVDCQVNEAVETCGNWHNFFVVTSWPKIRVCFASFYSDRAPLEDLHFPYLPNLLSSCFLRCHATLPPSSPRQKKKQFFWKECCVTSYKETAVEETTIHLPLEGNLWVSRNVTVKKIVHDLCMPQNLSRAQLCHDIWVTQSPPSSDQRKFTFSIEMFQACWCQQFRRPVH